MGWREEIVFACLAECVLFRTGGVMCEFGSAELHLGNSSSTPTGSSNNSSSSDHSTAAVGLRVLSLQLCVHFKKEQFRSACKAPSWLMAGCGASKEDQ